MLSVKFRGNPDVNNPFEAVSETTNKQISELYHTENLTSNN